MSSDEGSTSGLRTPRHQTHHDGLDFTNLEHTTAEEIANFKESTAYTAPKGRATGHVGLAWWLEHDSDYAASVLKRYRLFFHSTFNEDRSNLIAKAPSMVAIYSLNGYTSGLRYVMSRLPKQATKEEALEMIAIAFIYCGPAGMERVAEIWSGLEWPETPPDPAVYPHGWGADPGAFSCGIDFSSPGLTADEVQMVEGWYLKYTGEIPPYVRLLIDANPQTLKDYRNRYENLARRIPKQIVPVSMLHYSVQMRSPAGIRENMLLARAFGISKDYVVSLIQNAVVYGGIESLSLVEAEAGDVLRSWDRGSGQ